jgi:riboflavin kinase / FMN adenylyltransferase
MGLLIKGIESDLAIARAGAIAIGNFDGVHRGHRALLERLQRLAHQVGGPAVVLTFDPPPTTLLRPDSAPPALTWMERRAEILFSLGIDVLCVYATDDSLLKLEPEAFFMQVLVEKLAVRGIVEGPNFRFGKDRRGDVDLLMELCIQKDVRLSIASAQSDDGEWISSSRIRSLIREGDLASANRLLLEPYRICGTVVKGSARGRTIGFPTANLESIPVLLPPNGVYAGRVTLDGRRLAAAIHIGPNPTFGDTIQKVEVHLIDYQGDLYDRRIEVEVLQQIRILKKFSGVEELTEQLRLDVERTRAIST